jgi:cytochrome c5
MRLRIPTLTALWMIFAGLTVLYACAPAATATPTPTAAPTATPGSMGKPPNQDSWILVDLPPDATQLQHGAEIYRLVCSACHAYSGEGLTDAWRATWNPKDQNCWQSKCHAANHPPDGFELPIAPAVVGRAALAPFPTAKELHDYIQLRMPWQEPNNMTEEEGWAVTAYVIKLNRMNPGPELNAENAAALSLHSEAVQPTAEAAPQETRPDKPFEVTPTARVVIGMAAILLAGILLAVALRRSEKSS